MPTTKRTIKSIICAVCTVVAGAIAFGALGCSKGTGTTSTWTATADDDLAVLTVQIAGGNVVAMPGDGWAPRDGYIQLQLSGSSIGGQEIDTVTQDGDALTVTLKSAGDEAASLDLVASEYRLEGGDAASIKTVSVTYADGQTTELEQAYE